MRRTLYDADHLAFAESFRAFSAAEIAPGFAAWEADGLIPRSFFRAAGHHGFLAFEIDEDLGGAGVEDFRFNAVLNEELYRAGYGGVGSAMTLHNDICLPYLLRYANEEQRARWLPGVASGETVLAIAMTEPGTGSDLSAIATTAVRDRDHYVVNGAKTFITNGINADLVVVAVRTDRASRHGGLSLLVIERGMEGFERGRKLDKIGLRSADTAELFFSDVHVPVENLLGDEGSGFSSLVGNLPRERLSIAIAAVASARVALEQTLAYVKERHAFGRPIGTFQNSRFVLAEARTEIELAQTYVDRCILALGDGGLEPDEAAMAKWWCSEMQGRVTDRCLQLHGGYGYTTEYPVARAFEDGRVTRIYGGTTEIMKDIVGRSMGL
ncbi:acyl-CoA dehydrogenase family protein [Patulibacter sp. NPDC049589]|uniref:acyl-CoA dehydrogenase family protein n=1 Tax=Patulibacter sp. NPDC049589 TaxID=3154731 RepID=UPI00341F5397